MGYISNRLNLFISENFDHYFLSGHDADEDSLYWVDHINRQTTLENPRRTLLQVQASALTQTNQAMRRYGMLTEESYRIPVSCDSDPSMSEVEIRFRFAEEIPETGYIHGKNHFSDSVYTSCPQEFYIMEVWAMPEKKLLQQAKQALIGASDDPVQFEDVNEDGFLDLSIDQHCPLHGFDNIKLDPHYWLWNPAKICFEPFTDRDIQQQNTEDSIRGRLADGYSVSFPVSEGNTLRRLAEKYYGSGSYYIEIYLHNQERIGPDPNHLPVGFWLTLPPEN